MIILSVVGSTGWGLCPRNLVNRGLIFGITGRGKEKIAQLMSASEKLADIDQIPVAVLPICRDRSVAHDPQSVRSGVGIRSALKPTDRCVYQFRHESGGQ